MDAVTPLPKLISGLFLGKKAFEIDETSGETPEFYLKLSTECVNEVDAILGMKNFDSLFHTGLERELKWAIYSARFYVKRLCSHPESLFEGRMAKASLEVFKLLFALAKQVESFTRSSCELNGTSLVTILLPNVWEHISSVGSDLKLCSTLFLKMSNSKVTESPWLDSSGSDSLFRSEDQWTTSLLANLEDARRWNKLNEEERSLATFLSERLVRPLSRGNPMVYEVDYRCLGLKKLLVLTLSCEVHEAIWLGAPVAMKTFTGSEHTVFRKKVTIFAGLSHPNVLSLLCTSIYGPLCVIVTELLDEDLHSLTEKTVKKFRGRGSGDSAPFTDLESVHMILQISEGMLYLHELGLVHGDLESSSILVKHAIEGRVEVEVGYVHCKVGDFWLSKIMESSSLRYLQTTNVGRSRWMAPEVINIKDGNHNVTEEAYDPFKADVYSFAMVCYEILTGKEPFFTFTNPQVKEKILLGERPTWTIEGLHETLMDLVENCWSSEASTRPSFDVICAKLRSLKLSIITKKLGNARGLVSSAPTFPDYYSPRIAEIIRKRRNNPEMDKVESEVEASRITWSELSASSDVGDALAADNSRVFKSLQEQWGDKFFQEWKEGEWELVEKFAEGGQAELFELRRMRFTEFSQIAMAGCNDAPWVMKMFKEGLPLLDLQKLLPPAMLANGDSRRYGYFRGGTFCNTIRGAMLFNGRFALLMDRQWGDLRKLMDERMIHNYMQGPPFTQNEALDCMLEIARGMAGLHEKNIIHGDLKAANVLVSGPGSVLENPHLLDPLSGKFKCYIGDYECSVGVQGTGFWRAPEILVAVKDRNVTPELFTKASDVYSYGMIVYEVLTGCIPFELDGLKLNEYDRVIDGYRPSLTMDHRSPDVWIQTLMTECWHQNPSERPTFKEIHEQILQFRE